MARSSLVRFAWLSIAAAVATMALKAVAYVLTGSVGLMSDAIESLVNLVGAVMALSMLTFFTQFVMGSHGMPRRYFDYVPQFEIYHRISSIGSISV